MVPLWWFSWWNSDLVIQYRGCKSSRTTTDYWVMCIWFSCFSPFHGSLPFFCYFKVHGYHLPQQIQKYTRLKSNQPNHPSLLTTGTDMTKSIFTLESKHNTSPNIHWFRAHLEKAVVMLIKYILQPNILPYTVRWHYSAQRENRWTFPDCFSNNKTNERTNSIAYLWSRTKK